MTIDGDNEVARICAAGMNLDGDPAAALALFMHAWELRSDDYEASIAAHFVARHQQSPEQTLHWNTLAVHHAEAVKDESAQPLFASLYLNLGESLRVLGRYREAMLAVTRGLSCLDLLPADGYRQFVEGGLRRLDERLVRDTEHHDVTLRHLDGNIDRGLPTADILMTFTREALR